MTFYKAWTLVKDSMDWRQNQLNDFNLCSPISEAMAYWKREWAIRTD
jgi:hypothetical protein